MCIGFCTLSHHMCETWSWRTCEMHLDLSLNLGVTLRKVNHKDKGLLVDLQINGSQYSSLKSTQEEGHTFFSRILTRHYLLNTNG
jgi:hypothetical protein